MMSLHIHKQHVVIALLGFYFHAENIESATRSANALALLLAKVILCRVLIWMTYLTRPGPKKEHLLSDTRRLSFWEYLN